MNDKPKTVNALEASVPGPRRQFDAKQAERDYPELKVMGHDELVSEWISARERIADLDAAIAALEAGRSGEAWDGLSVLIENTAAEYGTAYEGGREDGWSFSSEELHGFVRSLIRQTAAPQQPTGRSGEGNWHIATRQAWYESEIASAESHWIDHWQERYEDGDDVPDKEHFVALWLAERAPPTAATPQQPPPVGGAE